MILDDFAAEAGTLAGLTWNPTGAGGNVFVGHMPQAPDVAVMVADAGGSEASTKDGYDLPSVQFLIRGDRDPRTADSIWRALYSHFHGLRNKALPGGVYLIYSISTQSGPVRMGADDNGRHELSLNLRCAVQNATEHRP